MGSVIRSLYRRSYILSRTHQYVAATRHYKVGCSIFNTRSLGLFTLRLLFYLFVVLKTKKKKECVADRPFGVDVGRRSSELLYANYLRDKF